MAVWSEVCCTEIMSKHRFDSEYYNPYYQKLHKELLKTSPVKLKDIALITDGIHGSPNVVEKHKGVKYISAKCVKENGFSIDNCLYVSYKQNNANPRTQLRKNDIIITTVGTIGNVAVVDEEILPSNCDRHVGIIRLNIQDEYYPYFISSFMNSKYGRFQSIRESAGNVQLNLYISNIGRILIPSVNGEEQQIAQKTKKAYELKQLSQALYTQAQDLLERELGLDKLKFEKSLTYEAKLSEVVENSKFSSYFFQPKYLQLEKLLQPISVKLKFLIKSYSSGFAFTKKHLAKNETKNKLIKINNINPKGITLDACDFLNETGRLAGKNEITVDGDILIGMSGTIGISGVIDKEYEGCFINQRILRIRPIESIPNQYLALILNSIIGQMQLIRVGTGGVQINISASDILNINIPRIENKENEIADLLESSKKAKTESEQLLEQAKRRVEELIEQAIEK